jgi:hypothetical protein
MANEEYLTDLLRFFICKNIVKHHYLVFQVLLCPITKSKNKSDSYIFENTVGNNKVKCNFRLALAALCK